MPGAFCQAGVLESTPDSVRPSDATNAMKNKESQARMISGVDEEEEEHVKAKQVKRGSNVTLPTEAEYEEHMISHYPFRNWCPHCIRGKANAGAHRMDKGLVKDHPTIHMDYCFPVKRKAEESVDEYTAKRGAPILVQYDDKLGVISATYVNEKGVNPRSIAIVKTFLEKLGHKKVTIKSDQERAIIAMREEIKRHTWVEIVDEKSKAYDSQSNGQAENAVQIVEKQFRTLRDSFETRIGSRLSSCHPFISYLVEHAAKTINRYRVGQDGRTSYRRWKGKDFKVEIPEIGEKVFYLPRKIDIVDKSVPRWSYGIFVGVTDDSNEMQIAVGGDVKLVRDVRRLVKVGDRWDIEYFNANVTKNTWEHGGPEEHFVEDELMTAIPEIDDPITPSAGFVPEHQIKRMYLKASDARMRGLWPLRCPGCRSIRDNSRRQGHTEECRASIEKLLCERGDPRFQASYARMAEQAMDKEKGEKREAGEESEERQLKRQKKESEEEQPMTSSASAGNSSPSANVDKPELDEEGDVVMNVDLGKYFKIVNLDLVNYFCAKQANKIQQEVIGKVYSATLYDENVIEQVINISKASDAKKRAAMARARKTAQIAEVTQSKANLEFMSVYSSDTIDGLPAQCDCYECDVNVTVNLEGKPFMKKARMRSSMKLNRNELRNMSIHANNKVVKAKYAITKNLLLQAEEESAR